jgi:hypothetical protein
MAPHKGTIEQYSAQSMIYHLFLGINNEMARRLVFALKGGWT